MVNSQKKIFDAIAAASIFTNCAGIDTNNSQVITISTFTKFLETRQMEVWTEDQVKALIHVSAPRKALESPHSTNYFFFCTFRDMNQTRRFVLRIVCPLRVSLDI